ncbi:hypothetical protein ACFQZ4_17810 [Catellatospora coxensis]
MRRRHTRPGVLAQRGRRARAERLDGGHGGLRRVRQGLQRQGPDRPDHRDRRCAQGAGGTDAAKTQAAETKLREALTALETQITGVGAVAADPAVKAAFDQVAANVRQTATDLAFLDGVTKISELEAKLTPALLSWIMPLARICP